MTHFLICTVGWTAQEYWDSLTYRLLATCAGQITRKAVYVYPNNEARSCNHCCDGRTINVTYSEWMSVPLRYPTCHVISGLPGSTLVFYLLSQTARFSGKKLLNKKCVFWFSLQLFSEIFVILRRAERDTIENVYWSSCKVPVILVRL